MILSKGSSFEHWSRLPLYPLSNMDPNQMAIHLLVNKYNYISLVKIAWSSGQGLARDSDVYCPLCHWAAVWLGKVSLSVYSPALCQFYLVTFLSVFFIEILFDMDQLRYILWKMGHVRNHYKGYDLLNVFLICMYILFLYLKLGTLTM